MNFITFERDALFQEVWSTSISALAMKYGMSDNGLRKICIALDIPLPGRGHWQRITAGHNLPPPALPATKGPIQFVSTKAATGRPPPKDETWLQSRLSIETDSGSTITVEQELQNPHPFVKAAQKWVRREIIELYRSRDAVVNHSKTRSLEPNFEALNKPSWSGYIGRGSVMESPPDILPLRVSIEQSDRALRIWDALIKACVVRKIKVSVAELRLRVEEDGESVELRMSERIRQDASPGSREVKREPTGELRIFVQGIGVSKFEDQGDKLIETRLNDIIRYIFKCISQLKTQRIIFAERRKADAIAAEKKGLDRKAEVTARILRDEEDRQKALLIAEAGAWEQAAKIRAYADNVRTSIGLHGEPISEELQKWIDWTKSVADELDPTLRRVKGIVP